MDHNSAIQRVKQYLQNKKDVLMPLDDHEGCKKCGRVIYCGVKQLCKDTDCGLKYGNKTQQS
jgi:hypothetical protein